MATSEWLTQMAYGEQVQRSSLLTTLGHTTWLSTLRRGNTYSAIFQQYDVQCCISAGLSRQ